MAPAGDYTDTSSYSPDQTYRWWYERRWADGPTVCWVGLNPGTGDTDGKPRPTLGRMIRRAQDDGFAALRIVNLFSYRTTRPKVLLAAYAAGTDVVGPETDAHIAEAHALAELTIVAWGAHGHLDGRGATVARTLPGAMCLGTTARGEPRHPLYVRGDATLVPYRVPT